jgi:hypothetical protein
VFDSLGVIKKSLRGNGRSLPGLLKMKVVKKPATKAREGSAFTGEKAIFQAKPPAKVRIVT